MVLLPGLYAACDIDIVCLILWNVLLTTIIANIFLRTDNRIICLWFFGGPLGFPGFGSGINCPKVNSVGFTPVSAILFSISAIILFISSGLFLMSSAGMLSQPVLLLSLSFLLPFYFITAYGFFEFLWFYVWNGVGVFLLKDV